MPKRRELIEVTEDKYQEIVESYSGDTIADSKTIRKPFKYDGKLYVSTGGFWPGADSKHKKVEEAYQIILRKQFSGEPKWYGQRLRDDGTDWGEQRRNQPEGFYHGMLIKRGNIEWVIVGPELAFTPKLGTALKQLSML